MTVPHDLVSAAGGLSPFAFVLVAVAGLVMGLAPSTAALLPVTAGLVAGEERDAARRVLVMSGAFVLGVATVDMTLGALFGLLGAQVIDHVARTTPAWNVLLAAGLVVTGLAMLRKLRIRIPFVGRELRRPESVAGAYLLGIPFGLSTCPACTPMVLPAVGAAAASGSVGFGAALLFVFGLARGLPLVLASMSTRAITRMRWFARRVPFVERVTGWLLLAAGAYFLVQGARVGGFVP